MVHQLLGLWLYKNRKKVEKLEFDHRRLFFWQKISKLRADFWRKTEPKPQKLRNTNFLKVCHFLSRQNWIKLPHFYGNFTIFMLKEAKNRWSGGNFEFFTSFKVKIINFHIKLLKNWEIFEKLSVKFQKTEPKFPKTEQKSPETEKYKISHCFNKRQSGKKACIG